MQDVVRRFKKYNPDWNTFPEKVGVQLNDTHPTLAIPVINFLIPTNSLQGID